MIQARQIIPVHKPEAQVHAPMGTPIFPIMKHPVRLAPESDLLPRKTRGRHRRQIRYSWLAQRGSTYSSRRSAFHRYYDAFLQPEQARDFKHTQQYRISFQQKKERPLHHKSTQPIRNEAPPAPNPPLGQTICLFAYAGHDRSLKTMFYILPDTTSPLQCQRQDHAI